MDVEQYYLHLILFSSSGATSHRATQTRQHQCALLTMSSSIFGAEQHISEPLSSLAVLTGRHREYKHARPCFSQQSTSQRNQRVNEINESTIFNTAYGLFTHLAERFQRFSGFGALSTNQNAVFAGWRARRTHRAGARGHPTRGARDG